jgi:hypothetical protein
MTVRSRSIECGRVIVHNRVAVYSRISHIWNDGKDNDVYIVLLIRWVDKIRRIGLSFNESKIFRWTLSKILPCAHAC